MDDRGTIEESPLTVTVNRPSVSAARVRHMKCPTNFTGAEERREVSMFALCLS